MKLLLDEMMPLAIAVQLRQRGRDVEGVAERGTLREASDASIWAAAVSEGRVVVTEDADYRAFTREHGRLGASHPGIIFTSARRFPRGDARTIGRLVSALDALLASGAELDGREYWLR